MREINLGSNYHNLLLEDDDWGEECQYDPIDTTGYYEEISVRALSYATEANTTVDPLWKKITNKLRRSVDLPLPLKNEEMSEPQMPLLLNPLKM